MTRPPLPPFDTRTAHQKVRMAENAWNSRNPDLITAAYTETSQWRNRAEFLSGHTEIHAFLTRKFAAESDYRLIKELWTTAENRIAVRRQEVSQIFRKLCQDLSLVAFLDLLVKLGRVVECCSDLETQVLQLLEIM